MQLLSKYIFSFFLLKDSKWYYKEEYLIINYKLLFYVLFSHINTCINPCVFISLFALLILKINAEKFNSLLYVNYY